MENDPIGVPTELWRQMQETGLLGVLLPEDLGGLGLNMLDCAVIYEEFASGTPEMAKNVAQTLSKYKIVMLRGHGSFAIGQTLDEAFFWSSVLEEACQISVYARQINEPFIEYRKGSDAYTKW